MAYLEDTFPEIKARPKDPLSIHKMRLWIKYIDSYHPQCGAITYGIGIRNILLQRTKEEIDKEVANIPDVTKRINVIKNKFNKDVSKLRNKFSLKEAEQNATMATRRLAKRQITWLRSLKDHNSYDILEKNLIQKIHDLICQEFKL